ncbi:DUF1642 domain-containing protein [Streptococcus pseudopneumoniae]|uniref:DUF1642 domain-containing protein n=1 Tax=Streptococcus pseudopneumoniae TaxID=257758 RepID=UPI001419628A|nr:DUF1642 domain-containing protein [Streptococcus pseudopneumoniae]NIB97590.1 DUF1642 domain-containing protein [Streptococcus pseudopneumoniae]
MKLNELIKKYKKLEGVWNAEGAELARQIFLQDLEQLDEPQKVKVPQFVADWIEECKKKGDLSLGGAIQLPCPEIYEWLMDWENQELFAQAWIFGYEVEEEKQYAVKIKASGQYLAKTKLKEISFMYNGACSHFTRKQLEEAGFGWVFDCLGIEIEEVE